MKYFGLFHCQIGIRSLYVVIGNNVLYSPKSKINQIWDLKGRRPKPGKLLLPKEGKSVLKDNDLDRTFEIHPIMRDALLADIQRDTDFLCSNNLMDYSFLIGTAGERPQPMDGYVTFHLPEYEATFQLPSIFKSDGTEESHSCPYCGSEPFPGVPLRDENFKRKSAQGDTSLALGENKEEGRGERERAIEKSEEEANGSEKKGEREEKAAERRGGEMGSEPETGEDGGKKEEAKGKEEVRIKIASDEVIEIEDASRDSIRHAMGIQSETPILENYMIHSFDRGETFLVGIIDFLSPYALRKKSAHFFQRMVWDGDMLSLVPADYYKRRFNFFLCHVIIPRVPGRRIGDLRPMSPPHSPVSSPPPPKRSHPPSSPSLPPSSPSPQCFEMEIDRE